MTSTGAPHDLLTVRLLQVPVPLWGRTREHSEELQREFALMGMSEDRTGVPARLLELIRHLRARYGQASSPQEEQLRAALEQGVESVDVEYLLPPTVAEHSTAIGALLDEADDHCRAGDHLLTLATPEDLVVFRRWFLGEFVRQAHGEPPTPWPAYA